MGLVDYLRVEQIKAMYTQITPSLLTVVIVVYTLSLIVLWPVYDKVTLLIWYISGVVISVLRKLSAMRFQKIDINIENCQPWINRAIFWAFLSGISWGFIFVFFSSPDHFFRLLIILGIYGGLITLSGSNFGVYFPVYLVFAVPSTFLFVCKILFIGGEIFYIASALVVAYFIEMTSVALSAQKAFNKTAKLRFFNNKLLQEVVTQKETAEQAVKTKNQFLAAASHDLRQPLHAQGLFVNAIKELDLPEETNDIISKIQLSTEALNSLLNSLLDISRLDAESIEPTPSNFALKTIVDSIVYEYTDRASENGSNIEVELGDDISVYCDKALLSRLIRNLIDNAIKFTIDGTISINANSSYNYVSLSIIDTGCGIPVSEQKNVFNEFTQLDNPERDRQKGLGLGLAIVQRLSNLMKVDIKMESTYGAGTTFKLKIPSSVLSSIEIKKINQKELIDNEQPPFFKDKVIVVIDDEADILDGMQRVVNNWQARTIIATDALSAIKKLDAENLTPDLILADFRLRENKDGITATNNIRQHFATHIKAILITGDTSPDRLQLALSADATILHKPVNPNLLRDTAHQVISTQTSSL